jgi:hypothetical protein
MSSVDDIVGYVLNN